MYFESILDHFCVVPVCCTFYQMPKLFCCVAGCKNNNQNEKDNKIKSHIKENVTSIKFHYFPKDTAKRERWTEQVKRGVVNFKPTDSTVVCSNHFEYGKPTFLFPDPTWCMTVRAARSKSPVKRRKLVYHDSSLPSTSSDSMNSDVSDTSFPATDLVWLQHLVKPYPSTVPWYLLT